MPRRRVIEDDDDDENDADYRGSQAAPSASQATTTATQSTALTASEIDKKTKDVIKYLLLMDVKKVPIKRIDINKNVIKEGSRSFNAIMDKAKRELKAVFGLDLLEIDKKNKVYVLVSELDQEARAMHLLADRDLEKLALLMPILGERRMTMRMRMTKMVTMMVMMTMVVMTMVMMMMAMTTMVMMMMAMTTMSMITMVMTTMIMAMTMMATEISSKWRR